MSGGTLLAHGFNLSRLETEGDPAPVVQKVNLANWASFTSSRPRTPASSSRLLSSPPPRGSRGSTGRKETGAVEKRPRTGPCVSPPTAVGSPRTSTTRSTTPRRSGLRCRRRNRGEVRLRHAGARNQRGLVARRRADRVRLRPKDDRRSHGPVDQADRRRQEEISGVRRQPGPGGLVRGRTLPFLRRHPGAGKEKQSDLDPGSDRRNRATALVSDAISQGSSRFSPDGRWIAYTSDQSGTARGLRAPVSVGAGTWQISKAGGGFPTWRPTAKSSTP